MKKAKEKRGAWVTQSVEHPTLISAQVLRSTQGHEIKPTLGSMLDMESTWGGGEPKEKEKKIH